MQIVNRCQITGRIKLLASESKHNFPPHLIYVTTLPENTRDSRMIKWAIQDVPLSQRLQYNIKNHVIDTLPVT